MNVETERKKLRLDGYDYSEKGSYFITFCTQNKRCILCNVTFSTPVGAGVLDGPAVRFTEYGKCVAEQLEEINRVYRVYSDIRIDRYVVMPNHVHLLVSVLRKGPSGTPAPTNAAIPRLVSSLKRFTNRRCGEDLWQRSYYDHIIRDEADYVRHLNYIEENPARWAEDEFYTEETL